MRELAIYAASVTIGLCLGLIGAGGSILTIPVLVYLLKTDPAVSTIYSMFIVGSCSFVGSIRSFFNNLVDFKAATWFGIPSVIGVFAARKLIFPRLPEKFLFPGSFILSKDVFIMLALAGIMVVVSVQMLKSPHTNANPATHESPNKILFLAQGIITGILTGLLGVGGGFLIVPALLLWIKLSMKVAIGTALFIITINSATGFAASYASICIEWPLLLRFALGAITGILAGTKLAEQIAPGNLKKMLAWFILATAIYVMIKQVQVA